jgi:anti-sigma factor (TIGR02949 family)
MEDGCPKSGWSESHMNACDQMRARIVLYLDNELDEKERASLEAHLKICASCRDLYETERRFLETVRGAAPRYKAGPALRSRIEEILADVPAPHTAPRTLRQRIERTLRRSFFGSGGVPFDGLLWRAAVLLLAFVVGYGVFGRYRNYEQPQQPSAFALMAVDKHQKHLRGQLPLEVVSGAPGQISGWFAAKVPFKLELPNYQESSGQEKLYELEGARLVSYGNDSAAYVAYRMQKRPISLLVTSEQTTEPSGGEEIVSKNITFHYDSIDGFKVITWADRGLTYALVSDLEERGQQSCIVCHQGTRDQDFIRSLKP